MSNPEQGYTTVDHIDYTIFDHITSQAKWSHETFGPGPRTKGLIDHIRKELVEVEESGGDLSEWIDVLTLAFDGCWRAFDEGWQTGARAREIVAALRAKLAKNEAREWPDWRERSEDEAIEHVRTDEEQAAKMTMEEATCETPFTLLQAEMDGMRARNARLTRELAWASRVLADALRTAREVAP